MPSVLVVDDLEIYREPIAAMLTQAGYTAFCAKDGNEALSLVIKHRPDVILLDLLMPGMNGLSFLRILRKDPAISATPVILLTAATDKLLLINAVKLGVRAAILKQKFTVQAMLDRVAYCLSPAAAAAAQPASQSAQAHNAAVARRSVTISKATNAQQPRASTAVTDIPQLLTRELCIQRAEQAMQAKTLSGVVAQVVSLATSPRGDMSQLATLISRDPVLSYRVLQAANSATYRSARGTVSTIPDAVRQIGCSTVRNIAAALGVFEAMPASTPGGFNPIRCWQHSFALSSTVGSEAWNSRDLKSRPH